MKVNHCEFLVFPVTNGKYAHRGRLGGKYIHSQPLACEFESHWSQFSFSAVPLLVDLDLLHSSASIMDNEMRAQEGLFFIFFLK